MKKGFYSEGEIKVDKYIRETYFPNYDYKGVIVEVGAATPEFISMSKHFNDNDWRAIMIEPNPTFAKQHRELGNEIIECACSYENEDDVNFVLMHAGSDSSNQNVISDHSFSSLSLKDSFVDFFNDRSWVNSIKRTNIKVKQRTLDTLIIENNIPKIDILTVDVEGWEIEVMKGLSTIQPTLVVLEHIGDINAKECNKHMEDFGYVMDKQLEHNYIYILKK